MANQGADIFEWISRPGKKDITNKNLAKRLDALACCMIHTATVTLTSAQVLALNTTPVTVIDSPGTSKAIVVLGGVVEVGSGTAYATNDEVDIRASTASTYQAASPANALATASTKTALQLESSLDSVVEDDSIVVTERTGDPVTGTASVKITLFYKVIDTL